jgi:hypothetical protein
MLDAVEKLRKRGSAETWPNCIESGCSSSKPPQVGYRGRQRLLCQFRRPPKSFSACRVPDPANFGTMPKMEFFNGILEFCTFCLDRAMTAWGQTQLCSDAYCMAGLPPLGGLNSDDARGRGCASGLADDLFGARSIWSTSMRFAHWFKSRGRLGRCSFAAGPCFSKLQHRLVRFRLGFASSRIRMWGAEMNLASLANRPTESAFA